MHRRVRHFTSMDGDWGRMGRTNTLDSDLQIVRHARAGPSPHAAVASGITFIFPDDLPFRSFEIVPKSINPACRMMRHLSGSAPRISSNEDNAQMREEDRRTSFIQVRLSGRFQTCLHKKIPFQPLQRVEKTGFCITVARRRPQAAKAETPTP